MLGRLPTRFWTYLDLQLVNRQLSLPIGLSVPFRQIMKKLLNRYRLYIEKRELTHIRVDFSFRDGPLTFIRRQLASIGLVALGLLLAIPSVPGPGLAFVAFALFIGSYPGKKRFINWIRDKKYFRYARIFLRKNLKILLIMPKQTSRDSKEISANEIDNSEIDDGEVDDEESE